MSWVGLDIGGANLKIADGKGYALSRAFSLWKFPHQLAATLAELLIQAPAADSIAVTMTGELADCYVTKAEGVAAILEAVEQAAEGREVCVYLCDGRFVQADTARAKALLAGASNWHVLADFMGRFCEGEQSLLIDIGSTTCDLIPRDRSGPCTHGRTDPERLAAGELVYTGVQRSPLCAVVRQLPWRGKPCPVAQEFFATTQDAYLLLGEMPEEPENHDTADGRPCTLSNAHARLARSICADTTMFSRVDAELAATMICESQVDLLAVSAQQVLDRMTAAPSTVVLSGQGEFLAKKLLARLSLACEVVSLAAKLGPEVSRSACAHALAILASERTKP
ncbi:MAG: H4MPT-linked C1 transfer pathway protein [Planctomycetes bacterium]|nr:H4MPT-linked C1 transfer pathway protein [Planctomycetota bacterium]